MKAQETSFIIFRSISVSGCIASSIWHPRECVDESRTDKSDFNGEDESWETVGEVIVAEMRRGVEVIAAT